MLKMTIFSPERKHDQKVSDIDQKKFICGILLESDLRRINFFSYNEKTANEEIKAYSNFHKCINEAIDSSKRLK